MNPEKHLCTWGTARERKRSMIKDILKLGNPQLYETCEEATKGELPQIQKITEDLRDTMMEFRRVHHAGRAIAAPQIGVKKRILYMNTGEQEITFINPILRFPEQEKMEILDDCMSFPGLYVRVMRYRKCIVEYRNLQWEHKQIQLEDDLSELIQHEYDHLDGILATMRAIDPKSFFMK